MKKIFSLLLTAIVIALFGISFIIIYPFVWILDWFDRRFTRCEQIKLEKKRGER